MKQNKYIKSLLQYNQINNISNLNSNFTTQTSNTLYTNYNSLNTTTLNLLQTNINTNLRITVIIHLIKFIHLIIQLKDNILQNYGIQ